MNHLLDLFAGVGVDARAINIEHQQTMTPARVTVHRMCPCILIVRSSEVVVCCKCCSVLQCVAVCCSVLQCVVLQSSVLQCVAVCCTVVMTLTRTRVTLHRMSPCILTVRSSKI